MNRLTVIVLLLLVVGSLNFGCGTSASNVQNVSQAALVFAPASVAMTGDDCATGVSAINTFNATLVLHYLQLTAEGNTTHAKTIKNLDAAALAETFEFIVISHGGQVHADVSIDLSALPNDDVIVVTALLYGTDTKGHPAYFASSFTCRR